MAKNLIEGAIVPENPSPARAQVKDKYTLYASPVRKGIPGIVQFAPEQFSIYPNGLVRFTGDGNGASLGDMAVGTEGHGFTEDDPLVGNTIYVNTSTDQIGSAGNKYVYVEKFYEGMRGTLIFATPQLTTGDAYVAMSIKSVTPSAYSLVMGYAGVSASTYSGATGDLGWSEVKDEGARVRIQYTEGDAPNKLLVMHFVIRDHIMYLYLESADVDDTKINMGADMYISTYPSHGSENDPLVGGRLCLSPGYARFGEKHVYCERFYEGMDFDIYLHMPNDCRWTKIFIHANDDVFPTRGLAKLPSDESRLSCGLSSKSVIRIQYIPPAYTAHEVYIKAYIRNRIVYVSIV